MAIYLVIYYNIYNTDSLILGGYSSQEKAEKKRDNHKKLFKQHKNNYEIARLTLDE